VFSLRPAPVQVNYLGFPGTMGAPFMDYLIADPIVVPETDKPFYSEQIVRLPDTYQANDGTREISDAPVDRARAGLPPSGFVFCCFNNSYKITPEFFDLWMRLLRQVEGSVLWLLASNDDATANLRQAAAARGVDPGRLVFAPHAKPHEHLARQQAADLFLDTLPVNAHTTACDALWVGLPVLTCPGRAMAARVAASALHAIGLPGLVALDLAAYEATALKLATDASALGAVRDRLATNRLTQSLFDTDRSRRHLEAAYDTMWQIWQRGETPRPFRLEPQ
jgi:predicted O-linked N-acetylglucosamine transferase (SPINDLY family)